MSEVDKLKKDLDDMGVELRGVTLGDNPGSPENVAAEIRKALKQLQNGEYTEVDVE